MTQIIMRNGQKNYFPDDASMDEINEALGQKQKSDISESLKSFLPKTPHGLNIATGLLSLPFSGEQAELVKNLPQMLTKQQPGISEKTEQFIGTMLPGMETGGTAAKETAKLVGKGIEYIQPQKEIPKFLETISSGAKTAEENIENLSREVKLAKISREEEALQPKRELIKQKGKETILKKGEVEIPNLEKIAKVFGVKGEELTSKQLQTLSKEVENYYKKGGDREKLVQKLEDIFEHPGLEEKGEAKLEKFIPDYPLKESKYLNKQNVTKGYGEGLKELHNNFSKNSSVENADQLMSAMKKEIRKLSAKQKAKTLDTTGEQLLEKLENNLDLLVNDFTSYVNKLPTELKGKYADFTSKWRIHVTPFEKEKIMRALSEGEHKGLTASDINRLFAFPSKDTLKVLGDLGQEAKNYVIYNFLQKADKQDVIKFANAILDAKKTKGYSKYITPEMEQLANQLIRRQHMRTTVENVATGLGGLAIGGPIGAGAAVGAKYLLPKIAKFLGKTMKK